MSEKTYQVQREFWHCGVRMQPGDRITLREREARYAVLSGDLTLLETPVETPVEAAGDAAAPRKRGK